MRRKLVSIGLAIPVVLVSFGLFPGQAVASPLREVGPRAQVGQISARQALPRSGPFGASRPSANVGTLPRLSWHPAQPAATAGTAPTTIGLQQSPQAPLVAIAHTKTVVAPFAGLPANGFEPPDTNLATGPSEVIEAVNSQLVTFHKDGTPKDAPVLMSTFFPVPVAFFMAQPGFTDPRIVYDPATARFYITELEFFAAPPPGVFQSVVVLGISTSNNPDLMGTSWFGFYIFASQFAPNYLCDQPQVGWSNDKITVTCSNFVNGTPPMFVQSLIRVLDKNEVVTNAATVYFQDVTSHPGAFAPSPARNYSDGEVQYVVWNHQVQAPSANSMGVFRITGTPASQVGISSVEDTINIGLTKTPPPADQQGSLATLDTGDNRYQSTVWQHQILWTAGDDSCTVPTAIVATGCMRFDKLATTPTLPPALSQDFDAGILAGHLFYPGVSMDAYDNLFVDFTSSSTISFPSFGYTAQLTGMAVNTLDPYVNLTSGQSFYNSVNPSPHRWGDYSGSVPDPSMPGTVWFAAELTPDINHNWGTELAAVQAFRCTSVTPSAGGPGPFPVGSMVPLSATAAGCPDAEFKYYMQPPGGSYALLRDWGVNTLMWTAGAKGLYHFSVWAREIGSTATPEAFAVLPVTTWVPPCVFGSVSANKASPQALGTAVTFTAAPGGCGIQTPEYQWFVNFNGVFTMVQAYSPTNTWVLDYTKMPSYGTYTIDVWIRAHNSGNVYDSFGLMSWVIGGCNFATTAAAANVFTTTAGGVACANPEYKVWIVGKGKPFFIAQDWTSNNVFTLNAGALGLTTNSYTVDVWVREHGVSVDPNYFETWGLALFINGAAPCNATAPTLTANPLSPASTGTTTAVLFTATGCGPNAQYEYWLYPGSGGGFQLLQGFSTTATYTLHPAALGLYAHNYSIVVWAKAQGSVTPDYDSYALYSYELNGCTSAGISADKADPQVAGTTITFTATSVGCSSPEYSFYVLPQGGTFSNVQPYSLTATLVWHSGGPGTYAVVVWVRQKTGPTGASAYESYAFMSFTITS